MNKDLEKDVVSEVEAMPEFVELVPATDVIEQPDGVKVVMDMPGISSEGVEIKVDNRRLDISAVSPFESRGNQIKFTRSFQLSDEIDAENIAAKVKNGVLILTLPKRPSAQVRKIKVATE